MTRYHVSMVAKFPVRGLQHLVWSWPARSSDEAEAELMAAMLKTGARILSVIAVAQ